MRSLKHITPRYVVDRLLDKSYRLSHPGLPWLTQEANNYLNEFVRTTDRGLEFGSGRSTLWLAGRLSFLTSVEHNPEWYRKTSLGLASANYRNVNYILAERDSEITSEDAEKYTSYVLVSAQFQPADLELILVDGIYRASCALTSIPLLRPGGILVIDDVNHYLPSSSRSPNSRGLTDGASSQSWEQFLSLTLDWRRLWFCNGVSDTAIFIKPNG